MDRKVVSLPGPASDLPFSPAVIHRSLVFVSGQIGRDQKGVLAEDFEAQTRQTMKNIERILEHAGSSLSRVLKVTVYLADMDRFPTFNSIYKTYFAGDYPARTTFQVGRLGPGVLIEIDAIASTDSVE